MVRRYVVEDDGLGPGQAGAVPTSLPVPVNLRGQEEAWRALRDTALELRLNGMSIRQISERLGISKGAVQKMLKKILMPYRDQEVEQNRALEEARLDRVARRLEIVVHAPEESGVRVPDRLSAIAMTMKLSEQRAKLLGLNAPVKSDVRMTHVTEDADATLRSLLDEVRSTGPA